MASRSLLAKRRAEASRLQLRLRYQAIADAAPDAIVSIDENNRSQLVNPAATKIFGWGEADLIGQPLTLLLPDFHAREHTTGAEMTGRRMGRTSLRAVRRTPFGPR
jgi:PAS domain S-box-containing protein